MAHPTPAAAASLHASRAGAAAAASAGERSSHPPQRWRKVLYAQQPYGDAYTSEAFLEELVVNATVPQRDYSTVVWSTLVVDQQLSTVAAVGSASYHLYQGTLSARQLLLADVLLMVLGSLLLLAASVWEAARRTAGAAGLPAAGAGAGSERAAGQAAAAAAAREAAAAHSGIISSLSLPVKSGAGASCSYSPSSPLPPSASSSPSKLPPQLPSSLQGWPPDSPDWPLSWHSVLEGLGSMASLAAATALLSPLLGTLTETVSSDSIVACACVLQLAHLFLHDYHFSANLTAHLTGSLALGCAGCGSVLIASRLGSPEAVYAQLLLSLELYILGPYCRRQVAAAGRGAHAALTLAMVASAGALLVRQSILMTSSFACSLIFVTFVCPMWLVRIDKFKAAINGPWDEAVPRLSRAVTRHLSQR